MHRTGTWQIRLNDYRLEHIIGRLSGRYYRTSIYHRWHAICCIIYICVCVCVCLSHATWQMRLGDKRLGHIYHPTGCRTGTSHHMARDLMYNIYNMYCHLTGATRRLESRRGISSDWLPKVSLTFMIDKTTKIIEYTYRHDHLCSACEP